MPVKFWSEAAKYYAYSWNRLCQSEQERTPCELYYGHQPSVRHLQQFGSLIFVGMPRQLRKNKLSPKSEKGYFVGYSVRTKGLKSGCLIKIK